MPIANEDNPEERATMKKGDLTYVWYKNASPNKIKKYGDGGFKHLVNRGGHEYTDRYYGCEGAIVERLPGSSLVSIWVLKDSERAKEVLKPKAAKYMFS